MAATLGIQKGVSYNADAKRKKLLDEAAAEAHRFHIHQYHPTITGKQWTSLAPPGVPETGFTYVYPDRLAIDERGSLYYAVIASGKNLGAATFYLSNAKESEGQWLDGGAAYKFTIREVANQCRFTDPNYFSRVFRKHFGKSPSIFRKTRRA